MVISIYCDAASLADIEKYAADPAVSGFTTNPSLMLKAGVKDYRSFAADVLQRVNGKPVSFEVLCDDMAEMVTQAEEIASWGPNVYVKIPVTFTDGRMTIPVIERLSSVNLNVTAIFTMRQIELVLSVMQRGILSIFAGRIADTGRDPSRIVQYAAAHCPHDVKVLWASAREVLNVYQAEAAKADIITLPPDLIEKLPLHGKDLSEFSLETVKMFHENGKGITL